jgi:nitrite reductase/ring-hydroxylating ferredoxin subunit/DMSO/TMAO reductase YedYZ heme-binding membrane subunit
MSIGYTAVGWNRQKKLYDSLIAGFCIFYLTVFIGITSIVNPEYTFETALIRSTSTLAFLLLHIILSIGPLSRLNNKYLPLLYNRRHLGVTMFCIASVHGIFSIIQFHSLGNVSPFVSLFTSNKNFTSVDGFPFQSLGFLALTILLLMAVTSHDFWLHILSPKVWKTLHMLVYVAYALIIMHVMLGVIQYDSHPVFILFVIIGFAWLATLHLIAGRKEVKKDNEQFAQSTEGYVHVSKVDDFKEGKARIFCIDKERIAVYKHENKLYAIHNVCKHQGGPLGEGKIIDGCITCPWHGYQYLPGNGQSPPPFKERVSTYDVKISGNDVFLNPTPYPEGTEKEGAIIN